MGSKESVGEKEKRSLVPLHERDEISANDPS